MTSEELFTALFNLDSFIDSRVHAQEFHILVSCLKKLYEKNTNTINELEEDKDSLLSQLSALKAELDSNKNIVCQEK